MKKTLALVVGARPQFVKAAPLLRALDGAFRAWTIHTGQHHDRDMSEIHHAQLGLPRPRFHLGVHGGTHGDQTARALAGVERVLLRQRPDAVIVFGDTNATLAGALAAAKLNIPVAHVEAGLRSHVRAMPEEVNRVLTDHLAHWLFVPSARARAQLAREGIRRGVWGVGDIMRDAVRLFGGAADAAPDPRWGVAAGDYYFATVHRAANTDDPERLRAILRLFGSLDRRVVFPVHPRTRARLKAGALSTPANVAAVRPLGYVESLAAQRRARAVLTDSGGVQKEAYYLGVPCVTLREETEWPETVAAGWNRLTGLDPRRVRAALARPRPRANTALYGDGHTAEKIRDVLLNPATWPRGTGR